MIVALMTLMTKAHYDTCDTELNTTVGAEYLTTKVSKM